MNGCVDTDQRARVHLERHTGHVRDDDAADGQSGELRDDRRLGGRRPGVFQGSLGDGSHGDCRQSSSSVLRFQYAVYSEPADDFELPGELVSRKGKGIGGAM